MKIKNTRSLRILLAFTMTLSQILGTLTACGTSQAPAPTETGASQGTASVSEAKEVSSAPGEASESAAAGQEPSVSEATDLTREDLDEETAALLDGEDHDFEREIAYRRYHDGESRMELSDTERNQWMEKSIWGFDANGNGVFAVNVDASMSQAWYFIEYTSDYGETWTSAGVYRMIKLIDDVKITGSRVVFSVENGVTESRHSLVYSDDLCKSFRERDTIDFVPRNMKAIWEEYGSQIGMDMLGIEQSDGSVVLGWYKSNGLEEFSQNGMNHHDYFLIGQTNADFTQMQNLFSADDW